MLVHEVLDELQIVAALHRRIEQLRLEELVEAQQSRAAPHFIAHQLIGGLSALLLEHAGENDVEDIERRIFGQESAQEVQPFLLFAELFIGADQPLGDERQVLRILRFDAFPRFDRGF